MYDTTLLHIFGVYVWRGPAQDFVFFYTGSHLSELQSSKLIFSTNFYLFSHLNSARQNLVIELCRALKIFKIFHSYFVNWRTVFVAIELLAFSIMQNYIFIAQENSQYLG